MPTRPLNNLIVFIFPDHSLPRPRAPSVDWSNGSYTTNYDIRPYKRAYSHLSHCATTNYREASQPDRKPTRIEFTMFRVPSVLESM